MLRARILSAVVFLCCLLPAIFAAQAAAEQSGAAPGWRLRIELCREEPSASRGVLYDAGGNVALTFPVGYGRMGWQEAGNRFRDGFSLLGQFKVNAILAPGRCDMVPELIRRSGWNERELRELLFRNMSSIDFDGDGRGGEYGGGYFSLEPVVQAESGGRGAVRQPFVFSHFKGVFRWYSFAIHGTQDQSRVGRASTGGCINVGEEPLAFLLERLQLGDAIEIVSVAVNE